MDEISALTETGEIDENESTLYQTPVNINVQRGSRANPRGRFELGSGRHGQHRGRGGRPFARNTGENDPYDMSLAPLNIISMKTKYCQ